MKMKKKIFLVILFAVTHSLLYAQEENWDVYLAQYEKGPGSTLLDMSLKQVAPIKNLPYVLVTGVKMIGCVRDGLPSKEEFEIFYKVSDSVKLYIDKKVINKQAGTFTYQCERLDYYYIADTAGIRDELARLYKKYFANYEPYISIKPDDKWEAYLDFLYPGEEIQEYMKNQKVVLQLQKSGDQLTKERQVDHWLYFKSEKDRDCFILYAQQKKFKIENKEKRNDFKNPYSLRISRTDKVDIPSITKVTLELNKEAANCGGDYDGWETFVIK